MASLQNNNNQPLTSAQLIGWSLFFVLIACLASFYLVVDFNGLSHAKGQEQAQIAREIARGHEFTTKCVRPLAIWQINQHLKDEDPKSKGVQLIGVRDTFHAPLNPLVNSVVMRFFKKNPEERQEKKGDDKSLPGDGLVFAGGQGVFHLDYAITGVSILMLLSAIALSYRLLTRIFDSKLASIVSVITLLSTALWKFTQTGLPQPMMLLLFTFAMLFFYRAIESANTGRPVLFWTVMTALFFGFLALAHWITIWVFIGAFIFAVIFLRPRIVVGAVMLGVFLLVILPWALLVHYDATGNPLGTGMYQFYAGLASGSESLVMRTLDPNTTPFNPDGILRKITLGVLSQFNVLYSSLGGVITAPLFFLSLLHPFKRPEIAQFRWAILLMWVWASIGMAIFGTSEGATDPNQLNYIFIPLMAAYGMAFLTIIWRNIPFVSDRTILNYGHYIIAIVISALPMLLTIPWELSAGISRPFRAQWPPYLPQAYPRLTDLTAPNEIIASDAPWAVAWYADRTSVWLPRTRKQFSEIYEMTKAKNQPITSLLLTPVSTHQPYGRTVLSKTGEYAEWAPLIETFSPIVNYGQRSALPINSVDPSFPLKSPNPVVGGEMILFTDGTKMVR